MNQDNLSKAVEAAARAHDAAVAEQEGDTSWWDAPPSDDPTADADHKLRRFAAMQAALTAALPLLGGEWLPIESASDWRLYLREWGLSGDRVTIRLTKTPRGADEAERLSAAMGAFSRMIGANRPPLPAHPEGGE